MQGTIQVECLSYGQQLVNCIHESNGCLKCRVRPCNLVSVCRECGRIRAHTPPPHPTLGEPSEQDSGISRFGQIQTVQKLSPAGDKRAGIGVTEVNMVAKTALGFEYKAERYELNLLRNKS